MFDIDTAIANGDNLYAYDTTTQQMFFKYRDDILLEYQALFSSLFPDLNLDPATPQGQIITALVQEDLATIGNFENQLNSFFFGGTGQYLDLWAWNLFRVTRKQGVAGTAIIHITGVAGTVIPSDFTITDGTIQYQISAQTTIPVSEYIDVLFNATTISTAISTPNTINQFVTVVDGVETVNNPSVSTEAILQETDDQLFNRCLYFGATATNSSFRSIMANISQITGVSKIAGAENYTDVNKVVKGITLTPHSICICVLGATDSEIATSIMNSRPTGCNMIGDTTVTVVDNGVDYTYTFYRPTSVPLKVKVEVDIDINSPTNWESTVKNNVIAFVENINIAGLITQPNLARYLHKNVSGFDIVDAKLSLESGVLGYDSIQLNLNQLATITTVNIEVVQV